MMIKSIQIFLTVFLLIPGSLVIAQSLTGLSGGYSIPTAKIYPDRTIWVGVTDLAEKYYDDYYFRGRYGIRPYFIGMTFLPFAEVSLRLTASPAVPDSINFTVDRMVSGRIRIMKERKFLPAVLIGLQSFANTSSFSDAGATFFNSTYLAATKNVELNKFIKTISLTLGYGSDIIKSNTYQYIGVFGGISLIPEKFNFMEIMIEYDADKWNVGSRITILKHLIILAGLEGMDAFSGGFCFRFTLP